MISHAGVRRPYFHYRLPPGPPQSARGCGEQEQQDRKADKLVRERPDISGRTCEPMNDDKGSKHQGRDPKQQGEQSDGSPNHQGKNNKDDKLE